MKSNTLKNKTKSWAQNSSNIEAEKRKQQINDAIDFAIAFFLVLAVIAVAWLLNRNSIINIF